MLLHRRCPYSHAHYSTLSRPAGSGHGESLPVQSNSCNGGGTVVFMSLRCRSNGEMRKAPADPRLAAGPACGSVGRAGTRRDGMDPVRGPSPFLEQVRAAIRVRHYSIRTEDSYLFWVRRFILFHGKRHPRDLGESQVGEFLTHLAVDRRVSTSTQNQALNALVFLYKAVLERPLGEIGGVVRARRARRLPVVLYVREVKALLRHLEGSHWLAACLMYGSGLRDGGAAVAGQGTSTLSTVPSEGMRAAVRKAGIDSRSRGGLNTPVGARSSFFSEGNGASQ